MLDPVDKGVEEEEEASGSGCTPVDEEGAGEGEEVELGATAAPPVDEEDTEPGVGAAAVELCELGAGLFVEERPPTLPVELPNTAVELTCAFVELYTAAPPPVELTPPPPLLLLAAPAPPPPAAPVEPSFGPAVEEDETTTRGPAVEELSFDEQTGPYQPELQLQLVLTPLYVQYP